jgi:hypothetical protein
VEDWSGRPWWSSRYLACYLTHRLGVRTRPRRWIFKGDKNPQHTFLGMGSKARRFQVERFYSMLKNYWSPTGMDRLNSNFLHPSPTSSRDVTVDGQSPLVDSLWVSLSRSRLPRFTSLSPGDGTVGPRPQYWAGTHPITTNLQCLWTMAAKGPNIHTPDDIGVWIATVEWYWKENPKEFVEILCYWRVSEQRRN